MSEVESEKGESLPFVERHDVPTPTMTSPARTPSPAPGESREQSVCTPSLSADDNVVNQQSLVTTAPVPAAGPAPVSPIHPPGPDVREAAVECHLLVFFENAIC